MDGCDFLWGDDWRDACCQLLFMTERDMQGIGAGVESQKDESGQDLQHATR